MASQVPGEKLRRSMPARACRMEIRAKHCYFIIALRYHELEGRWFDSEGCTFQPLAYLADQRRLLYGSRDGFLHAACFLRDSLVGNTKLRWARRLRSKSTDIYNGFVLLTKILKGATNSELGGFNFVISVGVFVVKIRNPQKREPFRAFRSKSKKNEYLWGKGKGTHTLLF